MCLFARATNYLSLVLSLLIKLLELVLDEVIDGWMGEWNCLIQFLDLTQAEDQDNFN